MPDMNTFNNPPERTEPAPKKKPNRRKKIIVSSILLIVLITGIAGFGFAKGFYDKHRPHGPLGFLMEMAVKDLDLTEQQKTEVNKLKDEIQAKMDSRKKEDKKAEMEEMMQMFRGDTFDKTKALELMKKRDAERDEMRQFMLDETAKFHAILTPEQRNKAVDKMKEFHDKKREMRDKFRKDDGKQ